MMTMIKVSYIKSLNIKVRISTNIKQYAKNAKTRKHYHNHDDDDDADADDVVNGIGHPILKQTHVCEDHLWFFCIRKGSSGTIIVQQFG